MKRRRKSSSEISYRNTKSQELLKKYGEEWRLTPCSFLTHWDTKLDDQASVDRINEINGTSKLVRRISYVAMTELRKKGTNIDDLVSRIYSSKELEGRQKDGVRNKFYSIFLVT
jgi:hypothetical protein